MIKIIISFIFLISQTGFAKDCESDVQYITKGDPAYCTGYLFSPEKEYEVRINNETAKHLKKYTEKQNELIDIMNQRIGNLQEYNNKLSNELERKNNLDFWKASLYFVLGIAVTGVIVNNVN